MKYSCTLQRQLVSFYFWVYSGLPCQSGRDGPRWKRCWDGTEWATLVEGLRVRPRVLALLLAACAATGAAAAAAAWDSSRPYTSPISARPSPPCRLVSITTANLMVIKYNTKHLWVMNYFRTCGLDPVPHRLGILAHWHSSFKTSRGRNLNPVKLFGIQNFISPLWCYL